MPRILVLLSFGSSFASFSGAYKMMDKMLAQQSWNSSRLYQASLPTQTNSKKITQFIIGVGYKVHMLQNTNLISSTSSGAEHKLSCGLTRRTALWRGGCWWLDTIGRISLSLCRGWGQRIFIFRRLPIQTPSGTSEGNELWFFFSWSLCKNNRKRIRGPVVVV